jgi:hypothetical protein
MPAISGPTIFDSASLVPGFLEVPADREDREATQGILELGPVAVAVDFLEAVPAVAGAAVADSLEAAVVVLGVDEAAQGAAEEARGLRAIATGIRHSSGIARAERTTVSPDRCTISSATPRLTRGRLL